MLDTRTMKYCNMALLKPAICSIQGFFRVVMILPRAQDATIYPGDGKHSCGEAFVKAGDWGAWLNGLMGVGWCSPKIIKHQWLMTPSSQLVVGLENVLFFNIIIEIDFQIFQRG